MMAQASFTAVEIILSKVKLQSLPSLFGQTNSVVHIPMAITECSDFAARNHMTLENQKCTFWSCNICYFLNLCCAKSREMGIFCI
jgi:hypothetical protein